MNVTTQNTIIRDFIVNSKKINEPVLRSSQEKQDAPDLSLEQFGEISFAKTDFSELIKELNWSPKNINLLYKQRIPRLYRYTEKMIVCLFFVSIFIMYLDFTFSWGLLEISGYIVFWLCCASMYFTNLWAKYDWKGKHKRVCVSNRKNQHKKVS